MSKLIKCKSCGAEIAKNAKSCPQCGAKNNPGCLRTILGTILLFFGIVIIIGALGGGSEEPSIAPGGNTPQDASDSTTVAPSNFGVRDRVVMNDIYVTLEAVTESTGTDFFQPSEGNVFIICEFTIENESDSELAVSSMMSFTAYADDYAAQLSLSGLSVSDKQQLDGSIAAGKKMNGVVAYEVPADWSEFEIHYVSNIYSTKEFVFAYSK